MMRFDFKLKGEKIWYLILILVLVISNRYFTNELVKNLDLSDNNQVNKALVIMLEFFVFGIINIILSFLIIKNIINSIYLNDKSFVFLGQLGEYFWLVVSSTFLMIITLFIYTPFYIRRYVKFISSNTYYEEKNFEFNGKGEELLGIMIFLLVIPYVTIVVLSLNLEEITPMKIVLFAIIFFIAFIMIVSYIFYYIKWLINFIYSDIEIRLRAKAKQSILFLLGQILLTIITLFIYLPASIIKIIQYIADNIRIDDYTDKLYKINTEFTIKESWKYLGLQILLSIVTIGIYLPWAYCNIIKYILERIVIEKKEPDSQQNSIIIESN